MTMFRTDLSQTSNNILSVMAHEDRPMTKTELATSINTTFQTITNNLIPLLGKKLVIPHRRRGNAQTFILGDPTMALTHIYWKDDEYPLDSIVRGYASGDTPVVNLSQFSRVFLKIFSEMYRLSADAIDDTNPKPITLGQMKELKATVARMKINLKQLLETCDSMLINDNLWNPQEIVNLLLIKPDDMTIELARSIAGNISEKLSGN